MILRASHEILFLRHPEEIQYFYGLPVKTHYIYEQAIQNCWICVIHSGSNYRAIYIGIGPLLVALLMLTI